MWFWNDRSYLSEAYDVARRLLAAGRSPPTARLQALKTVIWGANHALDGWSGQTPPSKQREIARELRDDRSLAQVLASGAQSRIYRVDRDLSGRRNGRARPSRRANEAAISLTLAADSGR